MKTKTNEKQGMKILLTGAVLQLFLGIIYVWSVFVMPVSEYFGWAADSAKLTSSFMLSFFVIGILIGGKIQTKTGTSTVVLTGGLMMAAGMLLTSFIPASAAALIYVTYGVAGGFGVGMAYNAIITCAQRWFPTRRGFATGISVCMFGFSTVVFAPLVEALIGAVGVANTFRILAAAFFLVVVALFRFIKLPPEEQEKAASPALSGKQYTTGEILKTKEFYFITLSLMFGTAAYFILNPSFKTLAAERSVDPALATVLVMITGIANALGRLAVPALADKIGREWAIMLICVATCVCAAGLAVTAGIMFMVVVAVIAFCYGGYSGVYPLITADYFGLKNVGSNYGAVMVGFAVSALFFPMLINLLSLTYSEMMKYMILCIMAAMAAALVLLLWMKKRKERA